ncbi:transmembrane protein, putative [Medicago truncatula]|uniref:Transmembrane protein, putative n=1 Tax=Medicago truncatula TaxID=3880 RepID=A0A072TYB5_MEDTR|nr:transmembrane protein, putative [Medicago truncatula]
MWLCHWPHATTIESLRHRLLPPLNLRAVIFTDQRFCLEILRITCIGVAIFTHFSVFLFVLGCTWCVFRTSDPMGVEFKKSALYPTEIARSQLK